MSHIHRKKSRPLGVALALASLTLTACDSPPDSSTTQGRPEAIDSRAFGHVHGLGVNPADGALYVASHMGVFRQTADGFVRVADRWQDTMAFTVIGPDQFLASGHPDMREDKPIHLGLIESDDAAESWQALSLEGEADFHALEPAGDRLYGYDSQTGTLMVTTDRTDWRDLMRLPVVDLAADPADADSLLVTDTSGRLMRLLDGTQPQLVADAPRLVFVDWPEENLLVGLSADGGVYRSGDGAESWQELTSLAGPPEALDVTAERWYAATGRGLYVSVDQARTWSSIDATP